MSMRIRRFIQIIANSIKGKKRILIIVMLLFLLSLYIQLSYYVPFPNIKDYNHQIKEPSNAELNTNKKTELHDESATQTKSLQNYIIFQLEGCNCTRKLLVNHSSKASNSENSGINDITFNQTTCGLDAFRRGPGQKVIAFSLYGDPNSKKSKARGYFDGIVGNLNLLDQYYKGWKIRLYHDFDAGNAIWKELCNLACQNSDLDLCNVKKLPGTPFKDGLKVFPPTWRYFPTLDPQVDVFASRDVDSRFSFRESSAVKEWREKSKKPIHVMRDHLRHQMVMLAGAWDADLTRKQSRMDWKVAWDRMLHDPLLYASRNEHIPDQKILERIVWKIFGRKKTLQHDSYLCKRYKGSIGYPTQRLMEPNNFVGAVANENVVLKVKCPIKCRRKVKWEYC